MVVSWERQVEDVATRFREAVVALRPNLQSACFFSFPNGACGDASLLLGQFLAEQGLGEWTYRSGKRADGWTHAWIEREGLIVDITADQFADIDTGVTVTWDRGWYEQFAPASGDAGTANIDSAGAVDSVTAGLKKDYELLTHYIGA